MADNDIIDFYKKADNDNRPEEPFKEQVETPEPVVSESVAVPVPESNDPFDKFLFNLAEKLKTEKKITEQQQQQFNERVVQPTTNPEDPFAKFLESFAGLVKQDENINKEENIKEATIDFINKLKNDDFFDYKKEEPKEEVKPEPKKKPKKYLPPKFVKKIEKVEEDVPVIEQSTEPEPELTSNPYLKELQSTDKKKSKVEDKISDLSDIKKIISQQVQEQLSKYPNLGFTGGGGGTNAVQYAEGGTMNGNLTVNGTLNAFTYLSGGVNLLNILSSSGGGGGAADRLTSGSAEFILDPDGKLHPLDNDLLTLQSENAALSAYTRIVLSPYGFFAYDNNSNSITFDSISDDIIITSQDLYEWTFSSEGKLIGPSGTLAVSGNVDVTNKILSGGVDLADIFITSAEESQTLAYDTQTELLSITRGNSVSLSSLSDKSYANSNFLRLSGGTISGNLTVQGNISALGTATFANTIFTTTSALSVINTGPGPALYVYQASGPYDVASFYDGDGIEVLHVGNAGPGGFGKVGVNESFPNEELTVRGSISATESIFATSILSGGVDLKDIFLTQQNAKFLPLSGGTLTGNTYVSSTNTEIIDLYQTAISAVYLEYTASSTPGQILTLPRVSGLSNNQPTYSIEGSPGEYWSLAWTGTEWSLTYFGFGVATFDNLDLSLATGTPVPGNLFSWESIETIELQYGTSNYVTKHFTEQNYLSLQGGTVNGTVTVNGIIDGNTVTNGVITLGGYQNLYIYGNTWSVNVGEELVPFSVIRQSTSVFEIPYVEDGNFYFRDGSNPTNNFITINPYYKQIGITYGGVEIANSDQWSAAYQNVSSQSLNTADNVQFNQVNANVYLSGGVNLLQILGPTVRQFDYVVQDSISYNYCGTAPQGSLTSDSTWTIKRLLFTSAGTLLSSGTVNNSIWDNRYSYSY